MKMSALTAGTVAPNFALPVLGGGEFSLTDALARGPVVLIFFKISCPTCQMAFPLYERFHRAYPGLTILGVSQNSASDTAAFAHKIGISFPILLDDTKT